jgi:proteasome beta subunit
MGASPEEAHGTTVLALRFDGGVAVLADRRATMGNLIMYEQAEKIEALDDQTVVAISGAYARSIEVCRYLKHAFKYNERLHLHEISAEGKLMEISRALAGNLQMAMQGVGVFLPIAAAYDPVRKSFGVYFFDAAGAKFLGSDYATAGSGSQHIRGIFDYLVRTKGPWPTRPQDEVLVDGLTMLDIAASLDSATGGWRQILPSVTILTAEGVRRIPEEELRPLAARALG